VFAAVIAAAVLIAGAFAVNWLAMQRLAAEQSNTNMLLVQIANLSEVSQTMASQKELQNFEADAMGSDFAWAPVFAKIDSALPSGVTTTGFDVTSGAVPSPQTKPEVAVGLTGTVTLSSRNAVDMAAIVRKLRTVPGVISADPQSLTDSTATPGEYTYLLNVTFNQTIYSGDYTQGAK